MNIWADLLEILQSFGMPCNSSSEKPLPNHEVREKFCWLFVHILFVATEMNSSQMYSLQKVSFMMSEMVRVSSHATLNKSGLVWHFS